MLNALRLLRKVLILAFKELTTYIDEFVCLERQKSNAANNEIVKRKKVLKFGERSEIWLGCQRENLREP